MIYRFSAAVREAAIRAKLAEMGIKIVKQYGPELSDLLSAGLRVSLKWQWLNKRVYYIKGKFANEEVKYVVDLLNETIKVLTDTSTRPNDYSAIVNKCINFAHHKTEGNRALERCKFMTETIIGYIVEFSITGTTEYIPLPTAFEWEENNLLCLPVRVYHIARIPYAEMETAPIWRLPLKF